MSERDYLAESGIDHTKYSDFLDQVQEIRRKNGTAPVL